MLLTDFGIAKVVGETSTMTTFQPFTADYASPEQVGNEPVDTRTDIYSLGATCHALLTGQVPFQGDYTAKIYGHRHLPPPPASAVRPDLPPGVDRVIATAMAKNPAERFPTCGHLAGALRHSLAATAATQIASEPGGHPPAYEAAPFAPPPGDPVRPHLPEQPPRTSPPGSWKAANRGRRWVVVAAATAIVLVGGGYAVQTSLGGRTGGTAADVAATRADPADGGAAAPQPSRAPSATATSPPAATSAPAATPPPAATSAPSTTVATGGSSTGAVPLESLLSPAPATRSGTSGGVPVAGAAAVPLGPSNCANGTQRYAVDVGAGLQRITGTFLMSDDADPDTRTQVTVTVDGAPLTQKTVASHAGVTVDVDVRGAQTVTIDLATAGSGTCGADDYLVFLTNAVAYR